jgi:hypothetical protein
MKRSDEAKIKLENGRVNDRINIDADSKKSDDDD